MARPAPWPRMNTGSRRQIAYASSVTPPPRLNSQKAVGMMLRRARSLAIHCTRKRPEKRAWPTNPIASHKLSDIRALQFVRHGHALAPPAQPPDPEKVERPNERPVQHAVFRAAVPARPVHDVEVPDSEALAQHQRRQEP